MGFEHYRRCGQKLLRCGFTTGTCAALAAQGAARLLLTGEVPSSLALTTPKGVAVSVVPETCRMEGDAAFCALRKDAGDDKDVTGGALIGARVKRAPGPGAEIHGGEGVGRLTKPGLDQPVGAAAINRVPRRMIGEALDAIADETGYEGGFWVEITVEGGAALAQKTMNPQLGIVGGISILGTSGIVEPMSLQAMRDTMALELRQHRAQGARHVILTPGNYGMEFLRAQGLLGRGAPVVKCSNFIGDALDECAVQGYESVLLVGHVGKLVKLAGGIFNTHSRTADCRRELFCCHGAVCGAGAETCRALLSAATCDGCIEILDRARLREPALKSLTEAMGAHLERRAQGAYKIGALFFSNIYGPLGETAGVREIMEGWT